MPRQVDIHVYPNAAWKRTIANFVETYSKIGKTIEETCAASAAEMVTSARARLVEMVYMAPLPASADMFSNPADYLTHDGGRRTGRVWKAIKIKDVATNGEVSKATAYVDRGDFPAYYYAMILNYGGEAIRYRARPFWSQAAKLMKARFYMRGKRTLSAIRVALEGGGSMIIANDTMLGADVVASDNGGPS